MLVLSRRQQEQIRVGDEIVITVVRVSSDRVQLGIEAPKHVRILRKELEVHHSRREDEDPATMVEQRLIA